MYRAKTSMWRKVARDDVSKQSKWQIMQDSVHRVRYFLYQEDNVELCILDRGMTFFFKFIIGFF